MQPNTPLQPQPNNEEPTQPSVPPVITPPDSVPSADPYTVPSIASPFAPGTEIEETDTPSKLENTLISVAIIGGGVGPGLIAVSIYLFIKSFISKESGLRKTAAIFMIIGVLITGAAYYFLFASKAQTITFGDTKVELQLPSGNKQIDNSSDMVSFGVPASGSSDLYAGQIIVSAPNTNGVVSADNLVEITQGDAYKSAVTAELKDFCSDVQLTTPQKIDIAGAKTAVQLAFRCPKQSDGSEYGGYVAEAATNNKVITIVVAADRALFEANAGQWDGVIPSVKLSQP